MSPSRLSGTLGIGLEIHGIGIRGMSLDPWSWICPNPEICPISASRLSGALGIGIHGIEIQMGLRWDADWIGIGVGLGLGLVLGLILGWDPWSWICPNPEIHPTSTSRLYGAERIGIGIHGIGIGDGVGWDEIMR